MKAACALDRQPVADGATLCRDCTRKLARDLRAIPGLVADLLITFSRQDHLAPQRNGGRSTSTPLVFNDGISTELAELDYYVASWTRCMAEDHALTLDGVHDTSTSAAWLLAYIGLIRRHSAADDLSTEIHRAVQRARGAIDQVVVSTRFPVGPCPEITDGAFCDGTVLATITIQDHRGDGDPPTMTCLRCHATWLSSQWLKAGRRIKNRSDEIGWTPPSRLLQDADA